MADQFTRSWIIENALDEIPNYSPGELTIRGLHYRMVARGMTNSQRHYKRVVEAMVQARWDGLVPFYTFSDNDRAMIGYTHYEETVLKDKIEKAKYQLRAWMTRYSKNRWENQPYYPEVFIEKKALQGLFQRPCDDMDVTLGACKGYPSLTFLNDTADRFTEAESNGKNPIILYFGDYDPSGEDIPRSIVSNLSRLGVEVELKRFALMEEQVVEWGLPPAPAKRTDSRTARWDGLGQVELDAVEPRKLQGLCLDAINSVFDKELYEELLEQESQEETKYRKKLKKYVTKNFS